MSSLSRVSVRFAVPPIDVESVNDTNSSRFAVPPVDVESVKLTAVFEILSTIQILQDSQFLLES